MKNAVRNLLAITSANPAATGAARAAALGFAQSKDPAAVEDSAGRIVFTVEWEPSFKDIKELSAKNKDATFTLYADSFAKQHWICKAVYQAGKANEENTYSRIDGEAFRRTYQEIFGEAFVEKNLA
ncbi:MAG TPA: hypothetical protein VK737_12395 [Opitutales bacterium]|jgi:hypothetical protein|nr:hypothetical protein [Opitutales bacterium]